MFQSGFAVRPCAHIPRISLMGVWTFRFAHNGHRGERAVCRHDGRGEQDGRGDGEAGFCI